MNHPKTRFPKRPFFSYRNHIRSKGRNRVRLLILLNIILLILALSWQYQEKSRVQEAVAKGQAMMRNNLFGPSDFDPLVVREILAEDAETAVLLNDTNASFLNAIPLGQGEARFWQDAGCGKQACAHATLFDYTQGNAVEAIVNLETELVLSQWRNETAQPAGSLFALPRAIDIAAEDGQVRAILGDIGAANPVMVPMSGWLLDDACRNEWCVDLTFQDPNGTGRIFHVFVNMEQERVARTFYTRARAERSLAEPLAQRDAFSNGCHEQHGWSVCWEMTAHDGIDFQNAIYNGRLIFSSAKIPQVEAWYPSWPGGYRDEIGFGASVPPFGDTRVVEFEDGFEVRQIFTEFLSWPNCVCCYRYEEVLRFYANGRFEPRFISHGPGCDDLSVYRPFWRIDLDLAGPENDSVWAWQSNQWVETTQETEFHPLIDDLSPEGFKLATFDGDLHYRWTMERTDPLGLDEGFFFLLQDNELEGEGPVLPGPGDTYQPPRQWLGGDPLSGENIVLWHVSLMKTKKSHPWWCMPDPEPAFSPCETILRAEPAGEIVQPIEEVEPTATIMAEPTASPTTIPTPVATATPRPIEGEDAETIILNSGCGACHSIGALGEKGKVGPDLTNIGLIAGQRVTGQSAEAYLREAILNPDIYIVPDCPNGPCISGIMPHDYSSRLTPSQIDTMVAFLLRQQDSPATAVPIIGSNNTLPQATTAAPAPKAFPAPKVTIPPPSFTPGQAVQILLVTLVAMITILRLMRHPPQEEEGE
ncbi:MAG: hypothetical protein AAF614_04690 [Chloroflexota bacterium]